MTAKRSGGPLDALFAGIPALLGRAPTAEERRRFSRYLELLLQWDKVHDLTGLKSAHDVVRNLFLDSLLFLIPMPKRRPLRVVDIGSGAGIPGLPLRIVDPEIALTLIESRQKRVSFLATVRRELGLDDVHVREGRAERLLEEHGDLRGAFGCVLLRGVRPTPALLTTCQSYLNPGGMLIVAGPPTAKAPALPEDGLETVIVDRPRLGLRRLFLVTPLGND